MLELDDFDRLDWNLISSLVLYFHDQESQGKADYSIEEIGEYVKCLYMELSGCPEIPGKEKWDEIWYKAHKLVYGTKIKKIKPAKLKEFILWNWVELMTFFRLPIEYKLTEYLKSLGCQPLKL